jgi:hypothetical protein
MKYLIIVGIMAILLLSGCSIQNGNTKDRISGYDIGIIWGHLYMMNDHKTVYCFDKSLMQSIKDAEDKNLTVKVTYKKNLVFTAFLCSADESYEKVEVVSIE